jgi:hypothetical protein
MTACDDDDERASAKLALWPQQRRLEEELAKVPKYLAKVLTKLGSECPKIS